MTLIDPREALSEQSNFISYLVGLASLGQAVRGLAAESGDRAEPQSDAGDFVHMLLGLASLGSAVERLAGSAPVQSRWETTAASPDSTSTRWLR